MNEFIVPALTDQITSFIFPTDGGAAENKIAHDSLYEYGYEYPYSYPYSYKDEVARAFVGGVELVVGGWGEYYVNSRAAASEFGTRLGDTYGGGSGRHIYPDDAVAAITELTWRRPGILRGAAIRLADSLAQLEDLLCEPSDDGIWECGAAAGLLRPQTSRGTSQHFTITIPPLTSADLRAAAADSRLGADPAAMDDLAAAAAETAAAVGLAPTSYNCNACTASSTAETCSSETFQRPVRVTDEAAVLQLERDSLKRLDTLERCQAALAGRLDVTAAAVTKAAAQLRKRATGDK